MKVNVMGTGRMGKAIVNELAKVYPGEVVLYSRDQQKAAQLIRELKIQAKPVSIDELFDTDIILHTLWYTDVLEWVKKYEEQLKGKIFIDITNPFNENYDDFVTPFDTSSAEEIQKLIPATKVAGAFKNTYWVVFDTPEYGGIKSDIYVTANDEDVRLRVIDLLKPLPFRVFDAGDLKNNRTIERMTLLEREIARKLGTHPRVSFHLWGYH